jgi:oligosaccharide reducing-end xylanase
MQKILLIIIVIVFLFIFLVGIKTIPLEFKNRHSGAYYTGIYPNLFSELLNKSESQIAAKLDKTFNQLFYGDPQFQRIYFPVEPDMAYIKDIIHNDVRSEGMSYGMMITVQLNKKKEFDRLWKWAKTYMQHPNGPRKNYFAWHCNPEGSIIDSNSASDGEEWLVMALFFAEARWGNQGSIYDYQAEAQAILDAMLSKETNSDRNDVVTNMFNRKTQQVVFVPVGNADDFTDPSYQLPHFYELWARWADKENQFWSAAASSSRQFLKETVNPITGLSPDYAHFDGTPVNPPWGGDHTDFRYDAWRVAMNIAIDHIWFAKDDWAVTQSNRLLNFFHSQGISKYGNLFTLDGKQLGTDHSTGLVAMNAVAALASTNDNRKEFVEELWHTSISAGFGRYYDGLLYTLAMLQVSGNFKIYEPKRN